MVLYLSLYNLARFHAKVRALPENYLFNCLARLDLRERMADILFRIESVFHFFLDVFDFGNYYGYNIKTIFMEDR